MVKKVLHALFSFSRAVMSQLIINCMNCEGVLTLALICDNQASTKGPPARE